LKAGRDHLDYLQDIMTMMEMIESFTAGMTKEDFIEDYKAHYAVIRAMEVMGEAAKNVPPDVRQRHPEIQHLSFSKGPLDERPLLHLLELLRGYPWSP
jgi:uncharacterized protein with HEPN domain